MGNIILILYLAVMVLVAINNCVVERKIRQFNHKLTEFERDFYKNPGIDVINREGFNEYYLLKTIPKRLKQIEFCYQCPLYQSKVQTDKQQIFQENK